VTQERQNELKQQIDKRFDQFSLEELRAADSGAMTFGTAYPNLPLREREFAEQYFNVKMDELRSRIQRNENVQLGQTES
jgi:hypothetical protein